MTRTKACVEVIFLVALGVLARLLPHLPNMTPIGAIAMRARARFGMLGLGVPLLGLVLSDMVIGFYNWRLLIAVYVSFATVGMLGACLAGTPTTVRVVSISIAGSLLFFVITNGAVWMFSPWYEKNFEGLLRCYAMGLPFLRTMALGDGIFGLFLLKFGPSLAQHFNSRERPIDQKLQHSAATG